MTLPFVSRVRLEYAERHIVLLRCMLSESADDLRELRLETLRLSASRTDSLIQTVIDLKRDGFEPPPEAIELEDEKDLPAMVWEAINEVSVKGSREYYAHMAYAHEALESETATDEIVHRIVYGQDVDL